MTSVDLCSLPDCQPVMVLSILVLSPLTPRGALGDEYHNLGQGVDYIDCRHVVFDLTGNIIARVEPDCAVTLASDLVTPLILLNIDHAGTW